jgi:transposase-like protein
MRDYSREFRMLIVERMLAGERASALSEEFGVHRKLIYEWMRRVQAGGESNLRGRGRPPKTSMVENAAGPRQIAELERTVAHQQLIIEFFRHALQRVEELRREKTLAGATASSALSTQ